TTGLQPHTENGWRVEASDIGAGEVYRDSNVVVTAIAVAHDGWAPGTAFGYKFVTADRTIVISGDTHPSEAIVAPCNGCDVLLHEVYSSEKLATRSPEWQCYHKDSHTSTVELAELAGR